MSHLLYRRRHACFVCGALTEQPCAGHECCGLLLVWQKRPWVPWWLWEIFSPPR